MHALCQRILRPREELLCGRTVDGVFLQEWIFDQKVDVVFNSHTIGDGMKSRQFGRGQEAVSEILSKNVLSLLLSLINQ